MKSVRSATADPISVLVADSNQMQSQLLVAALRRRPEFEVSFCELRHESIVHSVSAANVQVVILNATDHRRESQDMSALRRLHLARPDLAKILLVHGINQEMTVNAFRSGARGLFSFSEYPFRLLCKCIQRVHAGEIWLSNVHLQHLIDAVAHVPSLRVVNAKGVNLLTPREEQVVALVADGLSNRDIARELNLSEHTVKKYVFRIFDKLGISSRVELVLYAVSNGDHRQAEWVAGAQA